MYVSNVFLLIGILLIFPVAPAMSADDAGVKKLLKYYELKPSVVANVQKGAKYMRTDIQLMTYDEKDLEDIKLHAPALRHELFLLISDQEGTQLKDPKGKEKFRKEALEALQKVMHELTGKERIEELFFTSFFVQ